MRTYRACYWIDEDEQHEVVLTSPEEAHLSDEALLKIAQKLFWTWHARADDDPARWRRKIERCRRAFLERIRRPPRHHEAAKLARRFDRCGATAYFRFLEHTGVEPTNNATERAICQPVLDRRVTQGTRSPRGIAWSQRA